MRYYCQKNKLGFSLIELSIVILVIGILVIGITQGSRVIREAKLKSAQNLTTSSPLTSMSDLILWLESTSVKSFDDNEEIDTPLGSTGTLTNWYDLNPHTTSPNNAAQATAANKPRYIINGINGLPVVNFDGVASSNGDSMSFNGAALANSDYTIVIVEQRRSNKNSNYMIGGNGTKSANNILALGYRNNTQMTFAQYANDYNISVPGFSSPTPKVHVFKFNSGIGKYYSINNVPQTLSSGTTPTGTQGLLSYLNATIGVTENNTSTFFCGDIGEIIMFKRYLNNSETDAIIDYVESKWGIK